MEAKRLFVAMPYGKRKASLDIEKLGRLESPPKTAVNIP